MNITDLSVFSIIENSTALIGIMPIISLMKYQLLIKSTKKRSHDTKIMILGLRFEYEKIVRNMLWLLKVPIFFKYTKRQ